jgi:acetate kinase
LNVLALDSGSSSLKYALYEMPQERLVGSGSLEGRRDDQAAVLDRVIEAITSSGTSVDCVAHRIVLGGPAHPSDEIVTDGLLNDLAGVEALEPLHLPVQLSLVRRARELLPSAMNVACFDTAFFKDLPTVARRYPLPASLGPMVRRYGYHGLSYEYIVSTGSAAGRAVIAHLGSGASMAALRDGKPLDTTMGFSPLGGLMMGTRPGDLDPGVLLFLLQRQGMNADAIARLLNEQSGLLAVSETSADLRDLLSRSSSDARARAALDLFIYIAAKHANALVGVCGGLDTFIFTGGIGEHAPSIRHAICAGLAHLGLEVDPVLNDRSERRISLERSSADVFVIPTNEGIVIARHAHELVYRSV